MTKLVKAGGLTKYAPGSLKELISISFPMIITALSGNLMLFLDRIILGHYSLDAMNAIAAAGTAVFTFAFGAFGIASISEVFVGQANGAKKYQDIGAPVWQMIWFSLMTGVLFSIITLFFADNILAKPFHAEGLGYFKILMYTAFLIPLHGALAGFFVGRGKVYLVTTAVVIGNAVNLILDIVLVFGIDDWIPSMGAAGAGIATAIGEFIQVIIIFSVFLAPKYKNSFKTWQYKFNKGIFKDCLRIGTPSSISHTLELTAWYVIFIFMGWVSTDYVTVLQIGQTVFIFLAFFVDGLQRGVMALCSNAIGEQKYGKIGEVFKKAIQFHLVVSAVFAIFLIFMPNLLIQGFLSDEVMGVTSKIIIKEIEMAFIWVWVYLVLDGLVWIVIGILTAAGDTKFVMLISAAGAWLFAVLPVYIFIVIFKREAHIVWQMTAFYGFMNLIFFYLRYRSGKWKEIKIRST